MNTNYLEKLEYNKILENLSNFCSTYIGKSIALELLPDSNEFTVKKLLKETEEAINLSYRNSDPSFVNFSDITFELKVLKSNGSLNIKSILNLSIILRLAMELKDYFNKDFFDANEFPVLASLFSMLYSNKTITDRISSSIIDENTIDDKASKNLQSIRKQKRNLEQDIRNKLNEIIHSSKYSKYIQESVITIRNDRFVIPVKEEYRSSIKGFVHDISNAGSTLFIEPISIFEMNNEINELKIKEDNEIEKILQELSSLFFPYVEELYLNVQTIGKLDFVFAKAKYAKALKATIPNINNEKHIILNDARHPLIAGNKVVPISLTLGTDFSILVITGPNTGGKTVTLKTVGLLVAMACSGLAISASANSSIYVFDQIFADIGDDQSIIDSLSTFSSHMLNIVHITENATENSLILVDELGSGTDPLEGANIAISILDYFKSLGCVAVATTHYQELKQYTMVTDGFENASVEFDINTLSPTYRLLIGIPGKSNAFEISKKLGLKDEIINNAKSLINNNQVDIEELLKNIYDNKILIENEKEKISKDLEEIEKLKLSLEHDNEDLKIQEQEIINNAKLQARNILLEAKEDATSIIKQLNSSATSKELENARNTLNSKIKNINLLNSTNDDNLVSSLSVEEICPNMEVFVSNLGQNGTVISHVSRSNEVQVQVGSLKLNVNIKYLQSAKNINKNKPVVNNLGYSNISKSKTVKTEINVIGLNVEESIFVVDKFLDDASIAKLHTVRIVHGKGTGRLRKRYS